MAMTLGKTIRALEKIDFYLSENHHYSPEAQQQLTYALESIKDAELHVIEVFRMQCEFLKEQ